MWRIWYADGSVAKSERDAPFDVPGLGVLVIMQSHPVTGRWAQMGHDYYIWADGQWVGCDLFGLFDYLQQPGARKAIFGRTVSNEQYEATYQAAERDATLPERSILRHGEPRP